MRVEFSSKEQQRQRSLGKAGWAGEAGVGSKSEREGPTDKEVSGPVVPSKDAKTVALILSGMEALQDPSREWIRSDLFCDGITLADLVKISCGEAIWKRLQ